MSTPEPAKKRRASNGGHRTSHSFSSRRPHSRANSQALADSSEDEGSFATSPPSRRPSQSRSESISNAEPSAGRRSRAASAASRKRGNSSASRLDSPEKQKKVSGGGVAGWASSAVDSVRGKNKQDKDKDKDNFASLQDETGERGSLEKEESVRKSPIIKVPSMPSIMRRRSKSKVTEASPKISSKILKPPSMHNRRTVRALYDFSGSPDADELAFKAGDHIVVLSEVLDGWWMGELNGRKGLFPTSYTEGSLSKPTPKSRTAELPKDDERYETSDMDDYTSKKPLTPAETHSSPFFSGIIPPDTASEDEIGKHRFSIASDDTSISDTRPMIRRTPTDSSAISSTSSLGLGASSTSISRKAPPPPPPRRPTLSIGAGSAPPLPSRRPTSSLGSADTVSLTPPSSVNNHDMMTYDASPFDSVADLSVGCNDFVQAPFKHRGVCGNCMQVHEIA